MARDKLITIRIEGEKRQAFGELAKSQNTDTASLLYDFISGCLDGTLDIKLVTGKGNRIDKIDIKLDSDRLDKLETATQRLDNRLDTIAKKLTDWIEAFDDRLTDCDRELSEKTISLEHRLNALAIQLDSQEIDRIDTDSQQIDDIERESSIASPIETVESGSEPGTDAIETLPTVESDSIGEPCKGMNAAEAFRYVTKKGVKVSEKTLSNWVKLKQIPVTDKGDKVSEYLILRDGLYFPNPD